MAITGNPQNMLIGINSQIPYPKFLLSLLPVSFLSMLVIILAVRLFYPESFRSKQPLCLKEEKFEYNYSSMKFSIPIFLLVIVLFFISSKISMPIPVIALMGSSLILIFGKIKPSRIIKEVDWVLLLFFASLFIVVRGIEKVGLLDSILSQNVLSTNLKGISIVHGLSLFLSQIVSNVPFTIAMLPILKQSSSEILWLSLASASTLAGNATIIGAMANLIVIESASSFGIEIKFWEFLKIGFVVTTITLFISIGVLSLK